MIAYGFHYRPLSVDGQPLFEVAVTALCVPSHHDGELDFDLDALVVGDQKHVPPGALFDHMHDALCAAHADDIRAILASSAEIATDKSIAVV